MDEETIFVQTDPAFNVVIRSLNELRNQNLLEVIHVQTASLENIESNDESDDRRSMFGGDTATNANVAFGSTASAVVRMCMLAAVNVRRELWPQIGHNSEKRNKRPEKLVQEPLNPPFRIAEDRDAARRYWSKYDQLYPHFLIEHKVSHVNINAQASMPSMMLIFRRYFTELIEITTTFDATPREEQVFESYIHVTCIVRKIKEGKNLKDGEFTEQLKILMQPVTIQDEYFEEMTKVKEKRDLENLPDPLSGLKVEDKSE